MELKYFNINDDKETLKKKWKQLALKHHPDRNLGNVAASTKIMQEINNELAYCIKYGGGFDLSKFDMNNLHDVDELLRKMGNDLIEEALASETNYSVRKFMTQAKDFFQNFAKPSQVIKVLKDGDNDAGNNISEKK